MKIKYFTFLTTVLLLIGCSSLLDEKPFTFVAGDDLVESKSYNELVAGAYSGLHFSFEWGNFHQIVNFDTDYQTGPTWAFGKIGAGNFYEDENTKNFYNGFAITIHRANYHSYLISKMDIDEKEKNNALGELAFLKAFSYFNLVQFYGPVCLYKESVSEGAPLNIPRSSVKEVYEHIIGQLQYAEEKTYSVKDPNYKKGHVSSGAAKALLAKVYCTIGSASMETGNQIYVHGGVPVTYEDGEKIYVPEPEKLTFEKNRVAGYEDFNSLDYYKKGLAKAKELIELNDFDLFSSQEELWKKENKNGKEFIFSLQTQQDNPTLSNYVSKEYIGYYNELKNGILDAGFYILRDHWFQLFDETDERITWGVVHRQPFAFWDGKLQYCYYPARDSLKVKAGTDGYEPTDMLRYDAHLSGAKLNKFKQISHRDGNRSDFNWPFIRYAEVLLLYAEADNEVNNGPSAEAIAAVEKLNKRNKSKLASDIGLTEPWTKESFRSYILEERAKEFGEEGHRRFDLIRWGIYLQTMNAIGGADENGVLKRREKRHLLLPLPADEVNTNEHIDVNNPGW
jgi:hypothetical protein